MRYEVQKVSYEAKKVSYEVKKLVTRYEKVAPCMILSAGSAFANLSLQ